VWVPNDAGNTITRIDVATARVTETIQTAQNPAVASGVGGDVWAPMFDAGQVWRIRPS
jgi:DNA-binding beta-propeller fold protein YncE